MLQELTELHHENVVALLYCHVSWAWELAREDWGQGSGAGQGGLGAGLGSWPGRTGGRARVLAREGSGAGQGGLGAGLGSWPGTLWRAS